MKILIIEDDRDTASALKNGLSSLADIVEASADGADGSFLARNYDYDIIILDYSLPKKNGLTVLRDIRGAGKTTPVIFLSSTAETDVKVAALEAGADDYMTKPFSMKELVARVEAISRRPHAITEQVYSIGNVRLDSRRHSITCDGKKVGLTSKEFALVEYFLKNQSAVLSRSLIMEHVWSAENDPFSNTIEAHMTNLKKKLRAAGAPDFIHNIQGRGYIIEIRDEAVKEQS